LPKESKAETKKVDDEQKKEGKVESKNPETSKMVSPTQEKQSSPIKQALL